MAGRPKKKPEYNPELQFNNFLQELRDAYEDADSLRSLADELDISLLKLRKLLITADVFTSDICTEINDLHQSGKKIPEIMKLTGLSRASVHSYLPYTKGLYNAAEISINAERCRTYKNRQEEVRLLQEIPSEENLWQAVIAFQDYPFKTVTELPFRYKLKVGKNGEYNRELMIDRREKSKSLAWSSVVLAFENSKRISEEVKKPSANTSGRPSPTLASHVYEDMQGRIPLILDGGAVGIGIESTIIDMSTDTPTILRPGYITKDMLEEVLPKVNIDPAVTGRTMKKNVVAKAPGMKYRHYAPKGQLTLVEGDRDKVIARINELVKEKEEEGHKVGVIGTDETLDSYHADILRSIGSRQKPETVAANLYRILREFDDLECDYMYSESFFEQGLGNAIMNRMLKAAGYHLITL